MKNETCESESQIFNLCAEREYNIDLFEGRVERILVKDHNPPQVQILMHVQAPTLTLTTASRIAPLLP